MRAATRGYLVLALLLLAASLVNSCSTVTHRETIIAEDGRVWIDLNGPWLIAFDPQDAGERTGMVNGPPVDVQEITVPSAWQSTKAGADYEGVAWYYKSFDLPVEMNTGLRLCFDDVNYGARVWLNGRYVGEHEGGYVPFSFEVADVARPGSTNELVVRVVDTPRLRYADGLNLYEVPHAKESWYVNFGGICGSVSIRPHGDTWIEDLFLIPDPAGPAIKVLCRIRAPENSQPCILTATASSADDASLEYGSASVTIDPTTGKEFSLYLALREALAWSPEHPFLYRVSVRLVRGQTVLDKAADTTGLRTFDIRDNDFHLNGRRIVLKAVLNQPFFPATLCRPPHEGWCREQVRLIKQAGFNAVQNHVRLAPKCFLREADRQGLLVFQQPSIGWVYCSDDQALEERLSTQVAGMVLRDRNHPSIVLWGIFNEHSVEQSPTMAPRLAKMIRRLDPTRPILDETGAGRACCYPAGSERGEPYADLHAYPVTPVDDATSRQWRQQLAERGRTSLLVQSEYGYGGATDLNAAIEGYERHLRFCEDYRCFSELRNEVSRSVKSWPLNRKFDSPEDFAAALWRWQALAIAEQNEILACNPDLDMMCVTQWQDCVMESTAGLVDVWGAPKKAWQMFKRLNSPSRLILRLLRPTLFIGEDVVLEAFVVNESGLRGPAVLVVEFRDALGNEVSAPEFRVRLSGERVQSLETVSIGQPRSEVAHTIRARLSHLGETFDSTEVTILAISREAGRIASPLTVYDPAGKLKGYLGGHQAEMNGLATCGEVNPIIVATNLGSAPAPVVARFFAAVEDGAWGILLSPPQPGQPLHLSGMLSPRIEDVGPAWMGFHAYAVPHPIFEGLPVHELLGREYRNIMPRQILAASDRFKPDRSWQSVSGAVAGYRGFLGHCILLMPMGKGTIVLSTLRLVDNLGVDPLADRLLANMIRHAEQASGRTDIQPLSAGEVRRWQTEYERLLAEARSRRREFLLVGPWPLKPPEATGSQAAERGSSFDMVLPPEKELDPSATYTSWDDTEIRWGETEISPGGRLKLPPEFRRRYIVGYAYAYVRSPEAVTADLLVTSRMPIKVWFNRREKYLARDPITRLEGYQPSRKEIRSSVRVREGLNQLLIKFGWAGEPSYVEIQFLRHGEQVPGLEFVAPQALDLTEEETERTALDEQP